jgi:hypothetical protein
VSFYGFAYSTRSTIIRLANGGLWVWSPIELTAEIKDEIDRLGPVRNLVSPNKLHHLYLQQWAKAYPESKVWGPPSSMRKRPDLEFQAALTDDAPLEWRDQIDQVRFRGCVLLDEIEFHHPPSSTAIIADMSQNFTEQFIQSHWKWWQRPLARASKITTRNGYAPQDIRLSCIRRAAARASANRMLNWKPERVVMAHGAWVKADGQQFLRRAFSWLVP